MVRQLVTIATVLCWPACPLLASDKPASPQEAPKKMTLPKGFQATLFAGEPDVVQPIAFTFDDRGRLWVVECNSYPAWTKNTEGNDRVLIFEDKDGDGHFDKCTVFWDKGANLTGIEYGFGGIWLCSTPNLIFIPIKEGRDKPAGPPQIVLDGWDLTAKHNVFNSLTWGPDGWLYGCNGILSNSRVGAPGSPDVKRVALNCGVWRYHPTRKVFEVVAHGTTNPWGLDFDDYGRMFITNCVIKHLFHVIPGAHYERMFGQDINPYSYGLMQSCADHIHWAGGDWTSSRGGKGEHSDKGGGHAHSGAMVYLGDNWPDEYRNNVFMCNIHGNRINRTLFKTTAQESLPITVRISCSPTMNGSAALP
jgi:putative membrane-bound dehydrogenase-like protein